MNITRWETTINFEAFAQTGINVLLNFLKSFFIEDMRN